ncbi:MAG: glycosyltransferase family 9 protein, partial [Candidatus Aminicenantes bacterium]|nr:glycosyltransferase family 9 protein [Candidatus Aminicenantes bacterium]
MTLIDQPKIELPDINRILLLRLRRMGDIILTTPALRALRASWPKAYLCYVVESPYARLIEGNGLVDEVIILRPRSGLPELIKNIHKLRSHKFEVVIDFHGGPRSALLALTCGSRLRIGYHTKFRGWIYHYRVPRHSASGPIHSVVNHLNLIKTLNPKIEENFSLLVPPIRPEEKRKVDTFWQESGLTSRRVVAVHISAGNSFRDWGKKNLVTFLKKLISLKEPKPLLIGSVKDIAREKEIQRSLDQPVPSLVGQTNLGELMAALAKVDLFVGPDSGPMHLASALNKPIVALFGPTLPANFAPWKAKAVILEKPMTCRPCRQRSCPEKNFPCIQSISPEAVSYTHL